VNSGGLPGILFVSFAPGFLYRLLVYMRTRRPEVADMEYNLFSAAFFRLLIFRFASQKLLGIQFGVNKSNPVTIWLITS